jgi:hypothetical protein
MVNIRTRTLTDLNDFGVRIIFILTPATPRTPPPSRSVPLHQHHTLPVGHAVSGRPHLAEARSHGQEAGLSRQADSEAQALGETVREITVGEVSGRNPVLRTRRDRRTVAAAHGGSVEESAFGRVHMRAPLRSASDTCRAEAFEPSGGNAREREARGEKYPFSLSISRLVVAGGGKREGQRVRESRRGNLPLTSPVSCCLRPPLPRCDASASPLLSSPHPAREGAGGVVAVAVAVAVVVEV